MAILPAASSRAAAAESKPTVEVAAKLPATPNSPSADATRNTIAKSATLGGDQTRTTFVAALSRAVKVNVFTLADPYRVIIELPEVRFQLPQGLGKSGLGLVKGYRYGLFAAGKSRIVLDVTGPVLVEKTSIIEGSGAVPAQLVLELVPTDRVTFMAGQSRQLIASAQPSVPARLGAPVVSLTSAVKPARKPVIVIDPGHGGHDGGANKNGVTEKDVVLAFGKALRDLLVASGRYEVLMTRDTDRFIELDERREFARRNGAALFMAIHADYVRSGNHVRGATIYSLRESVANSLSRSLDKSSNGDLLAGVEVEAIKHTETDANTLKSILADLAQRELKSPTKTNLFAGKVIEDMGQTTQLKADPHRQAAFRVLKSGQVPSVLIELAYVSNRQDAENLKSAEWREKVATSIVNAVHRYFNRTGLPL